MAVEWVRMTAGRRDRWWGFVSAVWMGKRRGTIVVVWKAVWSAGKTALKWVDSREIQRGERTAEM